jgi:hypothetical protein
MADVVIQPAGSVSYGPPAKVIPSYLTIFHQGKKTFYFVAIKCDKGPACVEMIGFYYGGELEELYQNHDKVIKEEPATNFVDIAVPWNNIESVRSLVYRHKATK